jgi:hypothetical protein
VLQNNVCMYSKHPSRLFYILLFLFLIDARPTMAGVDSLNKAVPKKWYETLSIRGYTQIRYNRLLETNPDLGCEQCDRSWGKNGGFFMRRMRIIFFGQIHPRVYLYVQPDFAVSPSSDRLHFGQIRDAYFDVGFDEKNEFRVRIGQSKVPFGFENMQSSQNRLPLDRSDALNSPLSNERDIGLFFYYAPASIRKLFAELVSTGLKGSGDYGVLGFGLYNGQNANSPELNDKPHIVARACYPFQFGNQIIEPAIQAFKGDYTISKSNLSSGVGVKEDYTYLDERIAASLAVYPKPFGILAEFNSGRGPEFNKSTDSIETSALRGGFMTLFYKLDYRNQLFYPFTRLQWYDGGKKHERDARSYEVKELELGIEWQPVRNFELVVQYTWSERRYEDFLLQDNLQKGSLLRIQAQVNF